MDYIIVHELCHLEELNHGKQFWKLIEQTLPEYKNHIKELRAIERGGTTPQYLQKVKESHNQSVPVGVE